MPSASRNLSRLAVAVCSGALLLGAGVGCSTTQDKAAKHQAESERILERRAERQKQKKKQRAKAKHKQGKTKPDKGKK